ncbi:MAG TPA: tRNA (5-methylaminomethyl-2-thiouridine)(34)-methyltransferase MnmD [Pseudosphingobacterium sp.]|nr:tRNA (5-methylaminomethyl-2-thiouridine)(34)-methyltransferase MnmD [Pseudosphingobacterium sp.]
MDFIITDDGSKTIFNPIVGEHYHSTRGAVQESKHVFLAAGLQHFLSKEAVATGIPISILEIGFGTGLNFLITANYCHETQLVLTYTGIEAYPLTLDTINESGYEKEVSPSIWASFINRYDNALKQPQPLTEGISFEVVHQLVLDFNTTHVYDVLYFDAFAAVRQPEMWTIETLSHVCHFLKPGGVFVTYAITGNLKRIMKSLGFSIEKAPGAPGKREMLRAVKN